MAAYTGSECGHCFASVLSARTLQVNLMLLQTPPLIKDRLNSLHPFDEVTGVDYTGTLYVRTNSGEQKVYICLFTCVVSRAIHLEVVCDLTLQCFLQAFHRFVGRRSLLHLMLSDNALTYQAAVEEILICSIS